MGAWGMGPFENDDALDWVSDLSEGGVKCLTATFKELPKSKPDDDIETGQCCNAIAAAEVVAAMNGRGLKDLPEEITEWLATKPKSTPELVALARSAIERIGKDSELKDCWDEADPEDAKQWYASLKDLTNRLG